MTSKTHLYVIERKPCPDCKGLSKKDGAYCSVCNGAGEVKNEIPFEVAADRLIEKHPILNAVLQRMCH